MSRTKVLFVFVSLCLFMAVPLPLFAQAGQSGTISGSIATVDGNQLPEATITVTGEDGFQRSKVASSEGTFSVVDIPSGAYTVRASSPGFATVTQPAVSVAVGRNTQLTFTLSVAGTSQTVTVSASQSAFDTTQSSSVVNIDRDRVEELPIPNRNYLTFVLLSPQATPANPVLSQRTTSQGNGGFGFGGLRPSSNSVHIDGVSDDDEFTGSSRTQLSPEAISDFQIVNHGFSAESGGAAGGSIDVQTRQGINRLHGDAFLFEQNGALNGTPPLGIYPYKPDENRFRAGVALGGAIHPGKTFYYAAAEQELARGEESNDLNPATISQINAALQQPGPVQGLTLQTGFFPTADQETEVSGRLDRILSAHQSAMVRHAFTNSRNVADACNTDELSDRSARGSSFTSDNSINGTLTSSPSNESLNKFSFELSQRRAVERTGTAVFPGVLIPGVALFGTPYQGNSRRFETHLEFEEAAMLQRGHHLLQAGAGIDRVSLRAQVLDGSRGLFVFSTLNAFTNAAPDFFIQSFYSGPGTNFNEYRTRAYVQDHWTPTHSIAIDYGIRYENNHLPGSLPDHAMNFSPRAGIAWTPRKSLVLRSGFGIFYDRYLLSTVDRLMQLDGSHGFSQIVEEAAAAALYRTGAKSQQPVSSVAPSIWTAQPGLHNPYSEVASFSAEQALPFKTTLKAEYQFVHGVHLGRSTNTNLAAPTRLTPQNAASLGVSSPTPQQLGTLVFTPSRLNPTYDAINQFAGSAGSNYNGATVTLNRQFTDDFQLLAGYTFSKTFDDASFDTEQPQNPYDLRPERERALQDQRHRLTLSGLWLIGPDLTDPQDAVANANPGKLTRLLTGLEFAPILSVASGFRENPTTGLDSNREHVYPFAARPIGYTRNSVSAPPIIDFDLRILKMVTLGAGHLDIVAESFNLTNHRNVSLMSTAYGSDAVAQQSFNHPIGSLTARRFQFSLDYEF
ncbi:MAG: carboxypeptidase regulatory-like domain-containing protein [Acidobacteriota bacterium]|nr:carboxypeptidase regulatory-like domain-containing protein [Acidobacteriota bacterium]